MRTAHSHCHALPSPTGSSARWTRKPPPASSDSEGSGGPDLPSTPSALPKACSPLPHGLNKANQRHCFSLCVSVDPWCIRSSQRQERKREGPRGREKMVLGMIRTSMGSSEPSSSAPLHRGARCGPRGGSGSPRSLSQSVTRHWSLKLPFQHLQALLVIGPIAALCPNVPPPTLSWSSVSLAWGPGTAQPRGTTGAKTVTGCVMAPELPPPGRSLCVSRWST